MLIKILIQISPVRRPTPDKAYLYPWEVQRTLAVMQHYRRDREIARDKDKLKTYFTEVLQEIKRKRQQKKEEMT